MAVNPPSEKQKLCIEKMGDELGIVYYYLLYGKK